MALSNNRLKGLNNWLEGRVKELEDEVLKLKIDFDHLEIIYKFIEESKLPYHYCF